MTRVLTQRARQAVSWVLVIASLALSLAPSFATSEPRSAAASHPSQLKPPLPKACWAPSTLVGRDTQFLYLPCTDLRMVDSTTRAQIECTIEAMRRAGIPIRVAETYRSDWRQCRLWGQGRPWSKECNGRPGLIVTNAKTARQSAHGSGHGADLVHARDGWSNPKTWKPLRENAFLCGLEAGGSWTKFPDPPHVQNRTWTAARTKMVVPSPQAAATRSVVQHTGAFN